MAAVSLKEDIYWVGVKDPGLEVFDIIMATKKGTTYNSYLINDDKVVVIDSVKDGFWEESFKEIKEIIGNKKIDYIIVQHTELDHSGSVEKFLEEYPEATIIGTTAALNYLKEILNKDFKGENITNIKELNTGKNTLRFIGAPNLHWPDTMFTYVPEKNILFSCDFTGAHYCPGNIIQDEIKEDYFDEYKYYFDCIMAPFKKFVLAGLDKIKELKFDMIAPSHGPMHSEDNVKKALEDYREMATEEPLKENIQVFYISAYHNTEKMGKYICGKLNERGIKADSHEITEMDINDALELINKSTGFLVGSPTINQDAVEPAWRLLTSISVIPNRGKPSGAFGSYGWSGEGVGMMTERLKSMKFKTIDEGLKFKLVPGDKDFAAADEFIEKFVQLLK